MGDVPPPQKKRARITGKREIVQIGNMRGSNAPNRSTHQHLTKNTDEKQTQNPEIWQKTPNPT
jgi:hypothetical protein